MEKKATITEEKTTESSLNSEKERYCPLSLMTGKEPFKCLGKRCKWYITIENKGNCAFTVLAIASVHLTNLLTLLVNEEQSQSILYPDNLKKRR